MCENTGLEQIRAFETKQITVIHKSESVVSVSAEKGPWISDYFM